MSSDDGFHPEMTWDDDFQAKFDVILDERSISLGQLCQEMGVDEGEARNAIQLGTYGLPNTANTLSRLLSPFGLGLDYLLVGPVQPQKKTGKVSPSEIETRLGGAQRRQLRSLAWTAIESLNMAKHHRRKFANHIVETYTLKQQNTVVRAARPGTPKTVMDCVFIYERLLRCGYFDAA